jgi:hypothetical protein
MTVAAANRHWLPSFLGRVGRVGHYQISRSGEDEVAEHAMDRGDSPMCVLRLSSLYLTRTHLLTLLQKRPYPQHGPRQRLHPSWKYAHPPHAK